MRGQPETKNELEDEADELLVSLRWELARFRLAHLHVEGLEARRRVVASRGRIFTLLTGIPSADVTVIGRAMELTLDNASPTASDGLDGSILQAVRQWQDMPLADLWSRVSEYVKATRSSLSEQVMLLTYLEAFLPDDEPDDTWSLDVVAALATVLESPLPAEMFRACGRLTRCGGEASKTFAVQVGELALAALAQVLEPEWS